MLTKIFGISGRFIEIGLINGVFSLRIGTHTAYNPSEIPSDQRIVVFFVIANALGLVIAYFINGRRLRLVAN